MPKHNSHHHKLFQPPPNITVNVTQTVHETQQQAQSQAQAQSQTEEQTQEQGKNGCFDFLKKLFCCH